MSSGPPRRIVPRRVDRESIPWRRLLFDLVIVAVWVLAVTLLFRVTGWSRGIHYVVVFGGVVGYTLARGTRVVRTGR